MFPKFRGFLNKEKQNNSKSIIFPLPLEHIATQHEVEEEHENTRYEINEKIIIDSKIEKDLTIEVYLNNGDFYDLNHKSPTMEFIDESNKIDSSKSNQKISSNFDMGVYSDFFQESTLNMHLAKNEMLDKEIIGTLFTRIIERTEIIEDITDLIVDYLLENIPNSKLGCLLNEITRTEKLNNELDTNILINKINENIQQELQKISKNIIINLRSKIHA